MHRGAVIAHGKAEPVHGKKAMAKPDERPRTYGAGRVCSAEGCQTILSSYNPSAVCCLHSHSWAVSPNSSRHHREDRRVLVVNCQNPECRAEFATSNPAKKYCNDRCRMQAFQRRTTAERSRAAA